MLLRHLLAVGNFDFAFAGHKRSDLRAQMPHKPLPRETLAHSCFPFGELVIHLPASSCINASRYGGISDQLYVPTPTVGQMRKFIFNRRFTPHSLLPSNPSLEFLYQQSLQGGFPDAFDA